MPGKSVPRLSIHANCVSWAKAFIPRMRWCAILLVGSLSVLVRCAQGVSRDFLRFGLCLGIGDDGVVL
jgi:hypothetical protein